MEIGVQLGVTGAQRTAEGAPLAIRGHGEGTVLYKSNDAIDMTAQFTFFINTKHFTTGTGEYYIRMTNSNGTSSSQRLRINRTNAVTPRLEVLVGDAGASDLVNYTSTGDIQLPADTECNVLVSVNTATGTGNVYLTRSGTEYTQSITVTTGTIADRTRTHVLGNYAPSTGTSNSIDAEFKGFYFVTTALDITDADIRGLFYNPTTHEPRDLGSNGSTPTGTQPEIYLGSDVNDLNAGTNAGSYADFTVVGGRGYDYGAGINKLAWRPQETVDNATLANWTESPSAGHDPEATPSAWPTVFGQGIVMYNSAGATIQGIDLTSIPITTTDNAHWPLHFHFWMNDSGTAARYIDIVLSHDAGTNETTFRFHAYNAGSLGYFVLSVVPIWETLTLTAGHLPLSCSMTHTAGTGWDHTQGFNSLEVQWQDYDDCYHSVHAPSANRKAAFLGVTKGMGHTPCVMVRMSDGRDSVLRTAIQTTGGRTADEVLADPNENGLAEIPVTAMVIGTNVNVNSNYLSSSEMSTMEDTGRWLWGGHGGSALYDMAYIDVAVTSDFAVQETVSGATGSGEVEALIDNGDGTTRIVLKDGFTAGFTAEAVTGDVSGAGTCQGAEVDVTASEIAAEVDEEQKFVADNGLLSKAINHYGYPAGAWRSKSTTKNQAVRDGMELAGIDFAQMSVGSNTFPPGLISGGFDSVGLEKYALQGTSMENKTLFPEGDSANFNDLLTETLKNSGGARSLAFHQVVSGTGSGSLINIDQFEGYMQEIATGVAAGWLKCLFITDAYAEVTAQMGTSNTDFTGP